MGQDTISIHGSLQFVFDLDFPWERDWVAGMGDVPNLPAEDCSSKTSRVAIEYCPDLSVEGAREIEDGIFLPAEGVIDVRYGVHLIVPDEGGVILRLRHPCLEWFVVATQIAALQVGRVIVHAAAVEKDGVAVLFPSWGGVGKTGLVSRLIRERGWKLLGDDLVMIDAAGICYGLPKPMVLYPYHRSLFPEVFNAGKGPIAPKAANAALTKAALLVKPVLRPFPALLQFARRHNPQSVRVNPSDVFGMDRLARQAKLQAAFFLERNAGISELAFEDAEDKLASRIFGTTLNELNQQCVKLCNIGIGAGCISSGAFYGAWLSILDHAMEKITRRVVRIPAAMDVESMSEAIMACLDNESFAPAPVAQEG